jgi:hypothetical protein
VTNLGGIHRLLGHADAFNGDVQLQCPYVARGLRVRDPRYDERLHRAFAREARDWRLLLQVDHELDLEQTRQSCLACGGKLLDSSLYRRYQVCPVCRFRLEEEFGGHYEEVPVSV